MAGHNIYTGGTAPPYPFVGQSVTDMLGHHLLWTDTVVRAARNAKKAEANKRSAEAIERKRREEADRAR